MFEPFSDLGRDWRRKIDFKQPPYKLLTVPMRWFWCDYSLPVYVLDSVTFHLKYVQIILVRFRFLDGHLLDKSCSLGWSYCIYVFFVLRLFVIELFSV